MVSTEKKIFIRWSIIDGLQVLPRLGPSKREVAPVFYVYSPTTSPIPDLPNLGRLGHFSIRPDSEESFRFIEKKIHECLESHGSCIQSNSARLPKRLLEIKANCHETIRLIEPGDLQAKYIALSHCWGTHQPIKTTTSNLQQMYDLIRWESLSNVFQDAITVARRLNIQHIWIDSLCIIQDSKSDWETESSKMCDYYSNAYLTISASSSRDGTIPFLRPRDRKWLPVKKSFKTTYGTEAIVQARQHRGSSMTQLLEDLGPLASRGWVWQENVLSTRVLHYEESELIWECRSDLCSEDGALPRGLYSMRLSQKLQQGEKDPYRCWYNLIESYSVRNLTFESDRLPAISGVASRIQEMVGPDLEYLAGLWRENMPVELCWSVDYASVNSSNMEVLPESFVSPSWSWASVHGPLNFVDHDTSSPFEPLVTVIDVKCEIPGLNRYGEVAGGYLILRGPVVSMTVNCMDPYDCWTYTVGDDPDLREPMAPDCILVPFEIEGETSIKRARREDVPAGFCVEVECMRIGNDIGEDGSFMYGLLLGHAESNRDSYMRLGLVVLDSEDWFKGAVEKIVKIV